MVPTRWDFQTFTLPLAPVVGTHVTATSRTSVIWQICWPEGDVLVEWAPLPGWHHESIERQLPEAHHMVAATLSGQCLDSPWPSLRCLRDDILLSRSMRQFLPKCVPVAGLLNGALPMDLLRGQLDVLLGMGISEAKWKIGALGLEAAKGLWPLLRGFPLQWRFDVNESWDVAQAEEFLKGVDGVQFVEGLIGTSMFPQATDVKDAMNATEPLSLDGVFVVMKRNFVGRDAAMSVACRQKNLVLSCTYESPLALSYHVRRFPATGWAAGFGHLVSWADASFLVKWERGRWVVPMPVPEAMTEAWHAARNWR